MSVCKETFFIHPPACEKSNFLSVTKDTHAPSRHYLCSQSRVVLFVSFVLCFYSLIPAQLRGRIVDGRGHPLAEATVVTTATHMKTTSDIEGRFDFGTMRARFESGSKSDFIRLRGKKILLYLKESSFFSLEVFTLSGERIDAGFKRWLPRGSHEFDALRNDKLSSSVYILRIKIGKTTICSPIISGITRNFFAASAAFTSSGKNESLAKMNSGLDDTLEVSLDGYETTRIPLDSTGNFDTIALNTYSYATRFYNGTYQVKGDSLMILKKLLDTLQVACYCTATWLRADGSDSCGGYWLDSTHIITPETTTTKYSVIADTLRFFYDPDTCLHPVYPIEYPILVCTDTTPFIANYCVSYTRKNPGTGLEGAWEHPQVSHQVIVGTIDSLKLEQYRMSDSLDTYGDWKISNELLIFNNGNYYERASCTLTFSEGMIKDLQLRDGTFPDNPMGLNLGLKLSSELDISITEIDSTTVCVYGNKSGDSIIVKRLPNDDFILTSALSGNMPQLMKANPESCPDTAGWGWYFNFKAKNFIPYSQAKRIRK